MTEYYLGIDVGYAADHDTTGLCLITVDQANFNWICLNTGTDSNQRLNDLRNLIPRGTTLSGVGLDGPVVHGLQLVNYYRSAEALLSRGAFRGRCQPGQTSSGNGQNLHRHATQLAKLVLQLQVDGYLIIAGANHLEAIHHHRIVEAFPNAFLAFLLSLHEIPLAIPRDQRSDRYWAIAVRNSYLHSLIGLLAPRRRMANDLANVRDHDHRAAFICALSAMCVARDTYVSVGTRGSGDIILPPQAVWRADAAGQVSWAEPTLRANVNSVRVDHRQNNPCPNFNQAQVICNGHQWMPEPEQ